MTPALLVVNPFSGNKRGMRAAQLIAKRLRPHFDLSIFVSNAYGEAASEIQKRQHEIEVVFVVGGDGTVNEVLQVVVNTHLTLGLFPVGSGNATAYELGIFTMKIGIRKILQGRIKSYDCGRVNGRYFMNIAGTGFDTEVAKDFAQQNHRGLQGYVRLILKHYFRFKPLNITIETGNQKWEKKAFMVNIANMRQLGNFAFTAPMAKPNDAILDVCLLKPFPKAYTSDIIMRLFSLNLDKSRFYEHYPVKEVLIKGDFTHANVDGESIRVNGKMNIAVVPKSVKIYA